MRLLSTRLPCAKKVQDRFNKSFSRKSSQKDTEKHDLGNTEGQPQPLLEKQDKQEKYMENNWKQLGCALDRISFIIFTACEIILYAWCFTWKHNHYHYKKRRQLLTFSPIWGLQILVICGSAGWTRASSEVLDAVILQEHKMRHKLQNASKYNFVSYCE